MAAMGAMAAVAGTAAMGAVEEDRTGTRAMKAIKIGPISTGTSGSFFRFPSRIGFEI